MTSLMKCLYLNSLCCPPPHRVIEKCRGQEARRKSRDTTQDLSAREQSAIRCQAAAGSCSRLCSREAGTGVQYSLCVDISRRVTFCSVDGPTVLLQLSLPAALSVHGLTHRFPSFYVAVEIFSQDRQRQRDISS